MHLQPKCPDFKGASAPWIKVFVSQREMKIIWNKLGLILVHCWAKKKFHTTEKSLLWCRNKFWNARGKSGIAREIYKAVNELFTGVWGRGGGHIALRERPGQWTMFLSKLVHAYTRTSTRPYPCKAEPEFVRVEAFIVYGVFMYSLHQIR